MSCHLVIWNQYLKQIFIFICIMANCLACKVSHFANNLVDGCMFLSLCPSVRDENRIEIGRDLKRKYP